MSRTEGNFNNSGVISLNIVILIFIRALNIKGSHNKFSFDLEIDTGCVFYDISKIVCQCFKRYH